MRKSGAWAILAVALGGVGLGAWLVHANLPGWANAPANALAGFILVLVLLAAAPRDPFG